MPEQVKLADLWKHNSAALLERLAEPGRAARVQEFADELTLHPAPPIVLNADGVTIRDGLHRTLAASLAGRESIAAVIAP